MIAGWFLRVARREAAAQKGIWLPVAAVALGLVGWIDYKTGVEISFSIFYLLPIGVVAWTHGRWLRTCFCVFGGGVWLMVDLLGGHAYSQAWIPYWNAGVRFGFFLIISSLLAGVREILETEQQMAKTDALTGLPNSRSFYESASVEIQRARRNGHPLTVAYIDVDNFKDVNDRWGHPMGDVLLQSVARALRENLRTTDVRGRLGGDEFAVIMPELEADQARSVLENLRANLLTAMAHLALPITFSIGSVTFLPPPPSEVVMLREADALMYEVKKAQKNALLHEVFSSVESNPP